MVRLGFAAILGVIVAVVSLPLLGEEKAKQEPTPEFLVKVVAQWRKDIYSDDANTRVAAVEKLQPNAKDIKILFPEHAEKLRKLNELAKLELKSAFKELTAKDLEAAREHVDQTKEIRAIDVRKSDPSGSHKEVLEIIPTNVPVYRIAIIGDRLGMGMSSFLFLNGRWIHIKMFSRTPSILPKLDELLKEAETNLATE